LNNPPIWKHGRTRSVVVALAGVALTASIGALAGLTSPALAANKTAKIVDYAFQPQTITINQHETVTWTNTANRNHTVTSDDGTSFDSGALSHNDVFANLFDTAGTFKYHCSIYPTRMTGTIIVKAVAPTPKSSGSQPPTPPAGTLPPSFKVSVPTPSSEPSTSPMPSLLPGGGADGTSAGSSTPLLLGLLLIAVIVAVALYAAWRRRRP
jgi:plastocyanin